jgi:ribonuclease P protein component
VSGRLRFSRRSRLRKRRDFLRVQDKSARVTTAHFILLVAPRPAEGPTRLGIVASKKVGGAAARNRAKRLVRETFRTCPALFPGGIDLVVIAKPGAPELTLSVVCREVEGVAGLLARRAREVTRK